jgi:hypothetical protein
MINNYNNYCIRSFRLNIANSIEQYIYISIPARVKEIHLINLGVHKSGTQNLYNIDFNGLFPDNNIVYIHSSADNNFLSYLDLKFMNNGSIDKQFKITARLNDGTLLDTGSIVIYLKFIYE